jgi:hypothetical protein
MYSNNLPVGKNMNTNDDMDKGTIRRRQQTSSRYDIASERFMNFER